MKMMPHLRHFCSKEERSRIAIIGTTTDSLLFLVHGSDF